MPLTGRRGKNAERAPQPTLRRPSNPAGLAKAAAPAIRPPGRRGRGVRRTTLRKPPGPMPDSVTMGPVRIVASTDKVAAAHGRAGVLYRLLVCDSEGRPIDPKAYTIRKHVLQVKADGAFAFEDAEARIGVVALDEEGGSFDLVDAEAQGILDVGNPKSSARKGRIVDEWRAGTGRQAPAVDGEETVFEYFSFEFGGVTYAIPKSGFLVWRKRRGARCEVSRTPHAGGSIHGAVIAGLVRDGGSDGYLFEV